MNGRWLLIWAMTVGFGVLLLWQVSEAVGGSAPLDETHPALAAADPMPGGQVVLRLASAEAGHNIVLVRIEDAHGSPMPGVTKVTVFPEMLGHDMGTVTAAFETTRTGPGEFRADTNALEMFGTWVLRVAQYGDFGERINTFTLQLAPTRQQIVLFAGAPLTVLAAAIVALVIVSRRYGAPPPEIPVEVAPQL